MRGKVSNLVMFQPFRRITPAYAGKSGNSGVGLFDIEDHPRLCGEKNFSAKTPLHDLGSPPPMRGKAIAAITASGKTGITPAYAGKSKPEIPTR